MADEVNDENVGKGRPPKSTRFKPGKSGNPRGRKKGCKNYRSIVHNVAHETHTVTEQGCKVKHSTIALILKRLQERASWGELGPKALLDKIRKKYQPGEPEPQMRGIWVPPVLSIEEFEIEAAALRAKHAWVQVNREKIWEEMGLTGTRPKT